MFCTNNSDQRAIKAISKQIDKDLKSARRKLRTEKKLLLLGKIFPCLFGIFCNFFSKTPSLILTVLF